MRERLEVVLKIPMSGLFDIRINVKIAMKCAVNASKSSEFF